MGEVKRVLRLAGMLVHEGVNQDADENVRDVLTKRLRDLRDHYVKNDPEWGSVVREGGEIEIEVTKVAVGDMNVTGRQGARMRMSDENIDQLFDASGRILAAGEGLHRTYWKRYHSRQKPNDVKLELFALIRRSETIVELEKLARSEFDSLWQTYKGEIQKRPAAVRSRFHALTEASGKPTQIEWQLPEQIVEKKSGDRWKSHIYCDTEGDFYTELNSWEKTLLEELMKEKGFIGWLRNQPRREWALCVPYEMAGAKPFYPDFIIVRKKGRDFEADIFEPHDDSRTDTWAKAKGLATFADSHGVDFGRLVIARKKGEQFQFADMNDRVTREKSRKMQSPNDLESLFA